ncbi:hypothetical protein Patl1_17472 [Pistacia atlantica]|uniref:Uncharacterized protein n=1 Tax=Pistacia atlantica TaxID=434234 RepID=A0ACC1BYY4_9ROSI|nr:hypothetical protein Patl1_17472 [Pistacia atlantica]
MYCVVSPKVAKLNLLVPYIFSNRTQSAARVEDAIEILEYVLKLREEKLGIANPDFEDEKNRLAELLKEAGRARNRKAKSLENLIDPNSRRTKKEVTKRWPGLGFRI